MVFWVIRIIKITNMQFPQETYRWLVWLKIIPNEGVATDKKMVAVPPPLAAHFESGFNIGRIVRSLLERTGKPIPTALNTLREDNTKNTKLTNWNFVWLSFDNLDMQFDGRIKDLILQGETALIVEIVKQLADKDASKDDEAMKKIVVLERAGNKSEKNVSVRGGAKGNTVDIKKINLQKDPEESESSLEFLILLLSTSLGMPVEEILGLFTNQNKYLAHIIVKGLNDDFSAIVLFYTLLHKHSQKLRGYIDNDPKDADSFLYAIKPGFISKSPEVSELTISIFKKLDKNVYNWMIGESRGSTTMFLGFKRHPQLATPLWELISDIITENDIEFFTSHFKESFKDVREMVEICSLIVQPLSESYMAGKLLDMGIFAEWIQITLELSEGDLEDKVLSLGFLGEMMLCLPDAVSQNEQCLDLFTKDWAERPFIPFLRLLDEIFLILDKLAANKSPFASRIYQILIRIFESVCGDPSKKEYLVENFSLVIPDYPKMPTQYFIQAYKDKYIDAADYSLIYMVLLIKEDAEGLIAIGETLIGMYTHDAVANCYLGPCLYTIAKKIISEQQGQQFIKKLIRDLLKTYVTHETTKKEAHVSKPQPMYFNYKGNSQKLSEEVYDKARIQEKEANNIIELVNKLLDLSKSIDNDSLDSTLRNELLDANAQIRKSNFKINSKGITNILRKMGISKEDEQDYDEQYRNKKELVHMEESLSRKKQVINNLSMMASSRIGGPEHLRKEFSDMVDKRKKEEEERKQEEERRMKEQTIREIQIKKEIERQKLLRGYGTGEAELKEEGFWNKLIKEDKDLEVYPPTLMEQRDVDLIENIFKKYHRVTRLLFTKYSASMYSIKSVRNFEDNQTRKETISVVEVIKFLKDYKLFFLTNNSQVQNLIRDVNVKLLNKKETTQDLDFVSFEHFLVQFAAVIFTKSHTINAKTSKGTESMKKCLIHVGHGQLLHELFDYLKMVFMEKGEKTAIFDEPQAAYFNESDVIKEFNKKIETDPGFILPQGYKKVVDKTISLQPKLCETALKYIKPEIVDVIGILDDIIFESLGFHIHEPLTESTTKIRVKPSAFMNVKAKLMSDSFDVTKTRAMSSLVERKAPMIPPVKMMDRKVLSLGMKIGLSYVSYKDKLLGQQVAYVIDDMLNAVEQGKNSIEKQKIVNEVLKKKKQQEWMERKIESEKQRKRKQRKQELEKKKKEVIEKKEQEQEQTKEDREKKKQKELSREKQKKEEIAKFLASQKTKVIGKKDKKTEEQEKLEEEKKKKLSEEKKAKEKFKEFNEGQIQKLQKNFNEIQQKKKKSQEQTEEQKKHEEEIKRKLRSKIMADDRKIIEQRQKNNQQIAELYNSTEIDEVFQKFAPNLKSLYDFLIKNTFKSITERSHNNEIIMETWLTFSIDFHLNPYIIKPKQLMNIFRSLTKDKQHRKQHILGINYEQFQQALLRVAIKHKTVFNKIAQKIKQDDMSQKEINSVIDKDMEEKEKNEFEEPKQIDVKSLIVEEDINKEMHDDYGDIKKVTGTTLKGLIYYLKVPNDKAGQENRFRDILAKKQREYVHKHQKLKQKLQEEYSLTSAKKKKNPSPEKPPQKPVEESPPVSSRKKK